MIRHAMAYVQRAEKVMDEFEPLTNEHEALWHAKADLIDAESALVKAYSCWRAAMKQAAEGGSELAARYVKESEWDLT